MNLNGKQVIAIVIAVLGVLMASTAQLTDLFGPGATKTIVGVAGILNSLLSAILAVVMSQGSQVKDVLAMKGVENIGVNEKANPTLAALAVSNDPALSKIAPVAGAENKVAATARS